MPDQEIFHSLRGWLSLKLCQFGGEVGKIYHRILYKASERGVARPPPPTYTHTHTEPLSYVLTLLKL